MNNLDDMYASALANRETREPVDVMRDGREFLHMAQVSEAVGTVRPGALAGEMKPIAQSPIESIMERTGATLEEIGMALDSLGKVKLGPLEIGIRDFLPFVGGSETVTDPLTGKEEVVQVGTPAALQQMGRGESPVRGTGFATQMTPDVKLAAFDVPTLGAAVKPLAGAAQKIGREIATTPPTGAVQLAPTPVQAPKSDLGFYSAVEETVANLPQAKGTGQQFLAQISKTAGVKPEELQWTGLDEFLKGKKSVTKAEVQDYLSANKVDVQEVRLGNERVFTNSDEAINFIAMRQGTTAEDVINDYGYSNPNDYIDLAQNSLPRSADEWQSAIDWAEAKGDFDHAEILNNAWEASEGYGVEGVAKFSDYTLPGGENYREILLTLPAKQLTEAEARSVLNAAPDARLSQADIDFASRKQTQDFRSTHFDQPNILAHLRVNDRTVDGKKTLFVEEIQSDWHQAGRKKGYGESGVPDAPFKTSWHELSLKRAIQEASEKGYDQIAFTTGKTQAERYDLSKQINSIAVPTISANGTRSVRINAPSDSFKMMVDKDGVVTGYYSATQFTGKPLDEVVGKEMASKIMEATEPKEFSGLDLQVGGEGMKGFYDNILPKSLDKLGKKFNAKIGKTDMDGVEVWQMDITPKMRESVLSKGQPLFVAPIAAPGMMQDEEAK